MRISANSMTISVIGFCRPVSTLASLIGEVSGRVHEEMRTQRMRSDDGESEFMVTLPVIWFFSRFDAMVTLSFLNVN